MLVVARCTPILFVVVFIFSFFLFRYLITFSFFSRQFVLPPRLPLGPRDARLRLWSAALVKKIRAKFILARCSAFGQIMAWNWCRFSVCIWEAQRLPRAASDTPSPEPRLEVPNAVIFAMAPPGCLWQRPDGVNATRRIGFVYEIMALCMKLEKYWELCIKLKFTGT